jgi:hypothetical protein
MRYCARVAILALCVVFIMSVLSARNHSASTGVAFAEHALPPPAPIDVVKDATPGFTPTIESVVASGEPFGEDSMRRQLHDWGPKAVPVLIRLYEDPAWEKFRWTLMFMISCSDASDVRTWLKQQFQAIQASAPAPPREQSNIICYAMARTNDPELAKLLFDTAQNGKEPLQSACIGAIGEEMTNENALAVLKQVQASGMGGASLRLGDMITNMEGRLRAQRPMSEILEKEGKQ